MPLDDQIALSLYDRLQQVVTGADPAAGLPSAFDNHTTRLIMAQRGMVLDAADYRNPWSPGNLDGSQAATAAVAALVDDIPGDEAMWAPTQRKVSQVYKDLVDFVHVTEPPPSPEIQAARDRANAVLKEEGKDDEGRTTMRSTALADAEAKAFAAYQDAYTTYVATWAAAMADENLRRVWPMTGPTAVAKVRRAWSDWGAAGRDQVQAAKAELATLNEGQVARVFDEAQWLLNAYQFTVETELQPILRSRIQPSDWASDDASSWPSYHFSSGEVTTEHSEEATKWGAKAGIDTGIWHVKGGVDHSDAHSHLSNETTNIGISFRWRICPIQRPWLDATVFSLPNWDLGTMTPKGGVSANGAGLMPLIPSALLIVRDVEITGTWSREDTDHIESATSGSVDAGWGPFSVSGSYEHHDSKDTYHALKTDNGFLIPDIQILGIVCTEVPFCPPMP